MAKFTLLQNYITAIIGKYSTHESLKLLWVENMLIVKDIKFVGGTPSTIIGCNNHNISLLDPCSS